MRYHKTTYSLAVVAVLPGIVAFTTTSTQNNLIWTDWVAITATTTQSRSRWRMLGVQGGGGGGGRKEMNPLKRAAITRPAHNIDADSGNSWRSDPTVIREDQNDGASWYEYLLQEQETVQADSILSAHAKHEESMTTRTQLQNGITHRRRRILLPPRTSHDGIMKQSVLMASSTLAAPTEEMMQQQQQLQQRELTDEGISADADDGAEDPYADAFHKIQTFQEKQKSQTPAAWGNKLKEMDLSDIVVTFIFPAIALYAAGRWGFTRVSGKVQKTTDDTLDSFARELIYYDGDFKEMQLCVDDYNRRLIWMGPMKRDAMLKRYLATYAKKKTISPQAIASLSYAFALFKLSEEKAANLLVSLCRELGSDKIASAGKLLFLGSRILKSKEGAEALKPIKEMIKSTYRDAEVAETLVETSQQSIAEAAYKTAVQAAGKKQKGLAPGWEVLGLNRVTAERIFDEQAKDGFVSDRESMYGLQTQKYDKKGRRLDKDGKLESGEDGVQDKDDDDDDPSANGPISNVFECSQCGYTLFVAKGRESKFYGDSFKCPGCGAGKDKFNAKSEDD